MILSDDDRRAIDLMFDRGAAAMAGVDGQDFTSGEGMNTASYHPHASPISPMSLQAVQRVHDLIGLLDEEEVPSDLVERTMARIDAAGPRVSDVAIHPALRPNPSLPPA